MHVQIERALREAARSGRLVPGAPLPSSRTLARDLGISRGVVVEAYQQLVAEGFLETRPASGTVIARGVSSVSPDTAEVPPARVELDFRPGRPDLTLFPREDWARAARRVMRQLRPWQLDYGDPRGSIELRTARAQYLGRVRGVLSGANRIVVCNGFTQALGVAARALASQGVRRLAIEDPSQPDQRHILSQAGLTPVTVPVDGQGLVTERLREVRAEAVLVSPAHQFPTGSVLAPDRRRALIAWAARESAFVIEDDYDAEYRYDRAPVGALQGLAPDRVIYAGSTSKVLAPALRLGWLVVPSSLVGVTAEIKKWSDLGSAFIEQLVLAAFLQEGSLDRHLRRMRLVYRRRRDALLDALARHCADWRPSGAGAGLHLMAALPAEASEHEVVAAAAERSIRLYPLGQYALGRRRYPPAVVMGYAGLTEREIGVGVARLAARLARGR
jgi:GntR family transcriptional regulator / MocR family aminotransferase